MTTIKVEAEVCEELHGSADNAATIYKGCTTGSNVCVRVGSQWVKVEGMVHVP